MLCLGARVRGECGSSAAWTAAACLALSLLASGCDDGPSCSDASASEADADVTNPDGGEPGSWVPCCEDGVLDTCFCPAETECDYGYFASCGDGTCTNGSAESIPACDRDGGQAERDAQQDAAVDAGRDADVSSDASMDAGTDAGRDTGIPVGQDAGDWEPCCVDGGITTCLCPSGVACNYGWYTNCGDGVCVYGFATTDVSICPADAGQVDDAS
jgi:hypothetical protein